ncbi:methyltransferase domain-containing protein [Colletotrichum sublineola]|uniref:Putative methyltransferase domain-containing protein n=1 Tax=Colletotrichum sublineola TaxID=1173701 RepID=A0A066XB46_COLSU|nr:methyltransferase domain-containing protein [Colletotrichum sublineola]KDN64879.1 putative methyltransferase domain-containing protein [Colletotrichum sublineola]
MADTADTAEFAKGYTLVNDTQYATGLFLLDKLAVTPGERVLDVGCGPGNITAHIAELVAPGGGHVVGVDPSPERIALARTLKLPNLEFHVGSAEDLSRFAAASFDVVYVNSTFHWVQDQPAAAAEFARVLRPGGRLGISGGSGDFVAIHEVIKADVLARPPYRDYPDSGGPRFLKRAELEDILGTAGFGERRIVVNKIVKSAKDGYAMIDWLDTSSSGKTYGGIPLDLRPQAREEMKLEWDKVTTDEGIHMDMELLVTVAIKT